ncbi:hypothetical protein Cgig2_017768 [Carnegiea gigantea]|uniref:Zinc finger CHCC-type domain-containing protein n=1 Tax=Carnegiea gigantea TaxID=171969 RepID=A0A9Q1QR16_9CARY|nr:hypothetical protein Cgig2_017768 [Carnegiea gigantea]
MALSMLRNLAMSNTLRSNVRSFCIVNTEIITTHTEKWMQDTSKKSPMELINEVPPIKVEGRIVRCDGAPNPALGHPIEFICLDLAEPAAMGTRELRLYDQPLPSQDLQPANPMVQHLHLSSVHSPIPGNTENKVLIRKTMNTLGLFNKESSS